MAVAAYVDKAWVPLVNASALIAVCHTLPKIDSLGYIFSVGLAYSFDVGGFKS